MSNYDNTNRGALFKNDRRSNDKQPTYKGTVNVGGTEYWLSAWIKDGSAGKFFSLSVQPKNGQSQRQRSEEIDEDIPF